MCGIAAFHAPWDQAQTRRLEQALRSMRHRGPDGEGVWVSPRSGIGLGSVRLAIMDPAHGHQPLANETGDIHAVVNGELYEYDRWRADLQARGHVFATGSDSELLVHLYEEHGTECLRYLRGEFAFVLWDDRRQRLFAARDRFGIKPLHIARAHGGWFLGSEIKALIAAGIESRWNVSALRQALVHQYLRPGETFFHAVRLIPPAHALVIENGSTREFSYWRPDFTPDPAITSEAVREVLDEAVRLRLRSDVPVACTLSGGLDSSAVAALSGVRDCFCVRFDLPEYDEGPQVLADAPPHYRVHQVPVTRRDLVTHLEAAVRQSEGLAINGQLVGKYLLSRAIRDAGFKVVLAGEGADETFLGYVHLQEDHTGSPAMASLQRGVMLPAEGEVSGWKTPEWLERMPIFLQAKLATGRHFAALTDDQVAVHPCLDETIQEVGSVDGPFVRQSSWLWMRLALAGYILRTLGDGAEMAHSVEARLPFLDHVLFELAARIPPDALISRDNTKLLLRDALRGVVPESVRNRPKHPFLAPPLESEPAVRDFVRDTLHSEACRSLPLLNHAAVLRWTDALDAMPSPARARLDPVLMQLLTATLLQKSYRLS